jgi:hypothetical protein
VQWSGWNRIAGNRAIDTSAHELPSTLHLLAYRGDEIYHRGDWNTPPPGGSEDSLWRDFGNIREASRLTAASWGNDRIDVIGWSSGRLLHKFRTNFPEWDWTNWNDLGSGVSPFAPAVTSERPGQLNLFAIGMRQEVIHRWYVNNSWSGWESLGYSDTGFLAGPAACSWGPGRQDVFGVRVQHRDIVHKWFSNGWSGWESLGGAWNVAPAAATPWPGRLDLFGTGLNSQIYHRTFENGRWSPTWESLGGAVHPDHPRVVASAGSGGPLRVHHTGTDMAIYENWLM